MGIHLQPSRCVGRDVGTLPVLPARDRDLGSCQDLGESPVGQRALGQHLVVKVEHYTSSVIYQLG